MIIPKYETLRVTTMTLVASLTSEVNITAAFQLLPITRIEETENISRKKYQLPHSSVPGSILSLRYLNNVRGIVRNKSSPFKNSITIDISTKKKNICLKLSPRSIHMCGASSLEDGIEAANYVIDHLKYIQSVLNWFRAYPTETENLFNWITEETRGLLTAEDTITKKQLGGVTLIINELNIYTGIRYPSVEFPYYLVNYLLSMAFDYKHYDIYIRKLNAIKGALFNVLDSEVEVGSIEEVMVNYNYSLGFEVDRIALVRYINGIQGFGAHHNPELQSHTTIDIPYEPKTNSVSKNKKNFFPHHSFLVYRSGYVTQSGPGVALMKEPYYLFMNTIASIESMIKLQ